MVVWMNRWMSLSPRDRSPRSTIRWAIGQGVMGVAATAIATALAAPIAQAQNLTMLRCLQAADGDPYKIAQCSNPNARPPDFEEPAASPASPGGAAPRSRPNNSGNGSSGSNARPATIRRSNATTRTGVPASSYNPVNRVRATLDCLSDYSGSNQVLSECGAWSPRLNTGTAGASNTATPAGAGAPPSGNAPAMMPPPGTGGGAPNPEPIIWSR